MLKIAFNNNFIPVKFIVKVELFLHIKEMIGFS